MTDTLSVILLEPPRPKNLKRFEDVVNAPLSACLFTGYTASLLQENSIDAELVNAHLSDWSVEETITYLEKKCCRLLCVHTVYLWESTRNIFDMLMTVKERNPTLHINLYGYFPTFSYEEILSTFPFIDSITVGEPEHTARALAHHIKTRKNLHHANIPGLAFRDENGRILFSARSPVMNLDTLPFPRRDDIELYRKRGIVTYIQGSRGCYGHCTFCYLNPFYGEKTQWRCRSAENIYDEIQALYETYALTDFYFSDANFIGPGKSGKERALALAERIISSGLHICFGFECRANDINELVLSRLVQAGLSNVFLGLESGDQVSLNRFQKHTTVEENKRAIRLLRAYGIEPTFGFIMFEPATTLASIRNNFEFLKEAGIMVTPAVTAHLLHHRQTLFKGTPDYRILKSQKIHSDDLFTKYEAFYTIHDRKAEIFSEIITQVCRTALSMLPTTSVCGYNTFSPDNENDVLKAVNHTLIEVFEKTLYEFETNDIITGDKDMIANKRIQEFKKICNGIFSTPLHL